MRPISLLTSLLFASVTVCVAAGPGICRAQSEPAAEVRPATGDVAEPAVRKWKDSTGNFELQATFVGKDGNSVQLKKADGSVLKIPLDKLSQEDQAHVEALVAQAANAKPQPNPAVNPFETAEVVTPAKRKPARKVTQFDREADYSIMRSIAWQPATAKAFTPDAEAATPPRAGRAASLAGPGAGGAAKREDFFESPKSLHIARDKNEAVVVFVNAPPGGERRVRIVRCDLGDMRFVSQVEQELAGTPVDVSPSGNLLACLPEHFTPQGEQPMIEILRLEEKALSPVRGWNMGQHGDAAKRFDQLYFIGEDLLLATSAWGGHVTLWDIDKAQAQWQLKVAGHHTPALSANRNQFAALLEGGGIGVFDTVTGDTLARFEADLEQGGVLAFSSDGKHLACVTPRLVRAWDIASGNETHKVWFPKQMGAKTLDWLSPSQVLVDRSFVVDLDKRIVLWQYDLPTPKHEAISTMSGGAFWVLGGGGNSPYQLAGFKLPGAEATHKAQSLSADSVLVIKPGAAVQIKINVPGATTAEVQKVTKYLIEEARSKGLSLVSDAPITIECSIADAGEEKVTYRRFGFGPLGGGPFGGGPFGGRPFGGPIGGPFGRGPFAEDSGDEAKVNKKLSVVSIKENGKELWIASGHYGAPFHVRQKDGQSIQDAVNEQKGNPVQFFLNVDLPQYIARHETGGTYGKSKLWP